MSYNQEDRPTWNEYFKKLTILTASRSTCPRLKVGCILINGNRIISQGYNGYLSGCPHEAIMHDGHNVGTIHAEQNTISDCAKRGVQCLGSTAYITHYPCIICTRILLASGIEKIKYIEDYKNDELVDVFCKQCDVNVEKI